MTPYEKLAKRLRLTRAPTPEEVARAFTQLSYRSPAMVEKARAIICYRFGLFGCDTLTLRALGERYHLSTERIRQIEGQTLRQLLHERRLGFLRV